MDTVLGLVERLEAAPTAEAAWAVTVATLATLDVASCHHAYAGRHWQPSTRPPPVLRFSTLPGWWFQHHAAEGYWWADASARHCAHSATPMLTGLEFAQAASDAAWERMCADGHAAGFGCGIAVPLRGAPGSAYGGFSLLTRSHGAAFRAWHAAHARTAILVAHAASQRLLILAEADGAPERPRLSRRERECLLWLASGLRSDRIAERLGLSRATVDMHLSRARRRLGAATREQAVAKAITLGVLQP